MNLTISEEDARAMAVGAAEVNEIVGLVDESEEDSEESDESEDDEKESAHSMVHSVSPGYGKRSDKTIINILWYSGYVIIDNREIRFYYARLFWE